jgi:hypothetical protein
VPLLEETSELEPLVKRVLSDIGRIPDGQVVVVPPANVLLLLALAKRVVGGSVVTFTDSRALLRELHAVHRMRRLGTRLSLNPHPFSSHGMQCLKDASVDALVIDYTIPTADTMDHDVIELARALRPGARLVLMSAFQVKPVPDGLVEPLTAAGFEWTAVSPGECMQDMWRGGYMDIEMRDITDLLLSFWERRAMHVRTKGSAKGYRTLLEDPENGLGGALVYTYITGNRRRA